MYNIHSHYENIYHYLKSIIAHPRVLYLHPYGSTQPENIEVIAEDLTKVSGPCPLFIFYDQEPLNYNFYTEETCANALRQRWQLDTKKDKELTALQRSQKFIELYKKSHLRVATNVSYNLNDLVLLVHSEKNSIELNLYENNNFVGVYYWAHALIARDWYRFAYYDNELKENFDDINYDFLIYNRAWSGTREYRLKFVELLSNYNLVSNCNIKFFMPQ
mgnify:CR=1 FL=1